MTIHRVTAFLVFCLLNSPAWSVNFQFLEYDPAGRLSEADWERENTAFLKAVEETADGSTVTWENPETGNSGTITPETTFENSLGETCRRVKETFHSGEYRSQYAMPVCKQATGKWYQSNRR